jgi:hypothetical protein
MRVVTLPDGAQSVTVLPAAGGSPVFLGTSDVNVPAGVAEFAQLDVATNVLAGGEFQNVNGVDITGLFSSPVQPGDMLWVNALYISSPVVCFAAAIECTAQDTVSIAVVAFSPGNLSPGPLTCRIGRIAAPVL